MYDYLLVYFMIITAAVPANGVARNPQADLRLRDGAVSVQERFDTEALCRQRIEAVKGTVARMSGPSEKFELACHPIPRRGTGQEPRTS